jgi:hypothetical protein
MTLSSTNYQKYVEQLHSDNQDLVIKAAHALGDMGDNRAAPILIEILQTTSEQATRNAAALGLRTLGDERALYTIVSLINDPITQGNRGTLIYALEGFDCSKLLPLLTELVIIGNFEVSHQAFSVIESIDVEIDSSTLNICIQKIKEALLQNNTKADLLEDLNDLLYEMCNNINPDKIEV